MKTILNKIEFHYTYIIMAVGFILTGYFLNLIVFTSIILIHELGHYIVAKLENIKPLKIIIYPYGGLTKLDSIINTNINKELKIAIAGVVFQSIYFFIILFLYKHNSIRPYTFNLFYEYHYAIIFFNLLPIYPLDGAKIINLLLSKFLNFKLSNKLTILISVINLIVLTIINYYHLNYSYLMVLSLLINNLITYYKNLNYIYNKFLLERYLYNITYPKLKIIKNKNKMYKNYRHLIQNNNKIITERQFLKKIFD